MPIRPGNLDRFAPALSLALLSATVCLSFASGLWGSFFFDDIPNILLAESIRIADLSWESLRNTLAGGQSSPLGRPVAQISFALNYHFGELSPYAYKVINLTIHVTCAWLVYALSLRLFRTPRKEKTFSLYLSAILLTAAWALHPIQALPVLHVVQRMTSLSACFLVAGLILHIDGRQTGNRGKIIIAWAILWPLSIFSKETGVLFPLFALIWEYTLLRQERGHLDRFSRIFGYVSLAALLSIVCYVASPNGHWIFDGYTARSFTLYERLLTESRVLWFYLRLILLPDLEAFGLHHDDITISTSIFAPWTTAFSLTGIALLFAIAWRAHRKAPMVTFGILWFFFGHALESTVLALEIAHEHRNYIPSLGPLFAISWLLRNASAKEGKTRTFVATLSIGAIFYLAGLTTLRAHQYGDEIRRTQIEAQHHRNSARAQFDAGNVLASLDDAVLPNSPTHAFARRHFELANDLDQNAKMPLLALIQLNCRSGVQIEGEWILNLQHRLESKPFSPGDQSVLYALKNLLIEFPHCLSTEETKNIFHAAFSNPGISSTTQAFIYSWFADYLWLVQRDLKGAMSALKNSLERNPAHPSNRLKWAQLVFISGDIEQARKLLIDLRSSRLSPEEMNIREDLLARSHIAER